MGDRPYDEERRRVAELERRVARLTEAVGRLAEVSMVVAREGQMALQPRWWWSRKATKAALVRAHELSVAWGEARMAHGIALDRPVTAVLVEEKFHG